MDNLNELETDIRALQVAHRKVVRETTRSSTTTEAEAPSPSSSPSTEDSTDRKADDRGVIIDRRLDVGGAYSCMYVGSGHRLYGTHSLYTQRSQASCYAIDNN